MRNSCKSIRNVRYRLGIARRKFDVRTLDFESGDPLVEQQLSPIHPTDESCFDKL